MNQLYEKIKCNMYIIAAFVIGIFLRLYFGINAKNILQHDVFGNAGQMEYAKIIYKSFMLPTTNEWQFYQPPFNPFMQAMFMKVTRFITGIRNIDKLYSFCNWLAICYSIITLIFMYKILQLLCKNIFVKNLTFIIVSVYPGFIFGATQYNNDPPTLMFFFISLYLAIKWCKERKLFQITLLAISIGLGMLTKISIGLLAFIIGPMMLIILIKEKSVTVLKQLIIFALIVFPLGLSYAIRNFVLFNQNFNYVPLIDAKSVYVGNFNIFDRFLSLPINQLFFGKSRFYHNLKEYNVWIDLIKTSTYDEINNFDTIYHIPCVILLVINTMFSIISVISFIYNIVKLNDSRNDELRNISIILIVLSVISYVIFNITHPASCTSSYRYVSYATFAFAYLVSLMIFDISKRIEL